MSETSSEVKTHRKRPSDEVLKHNEACRRSRRSYTLCKKAYQLEQAGGGVKYLPWLKTGTAM